MVEPISKQDKAQSLFDEAQGYFEDHRYDDAFALIANAKALRVSLPGLDVLRAKVMKALGRSMKEVCTCLMEELSAHPDHQEARMLLEEWASMAQSGLPENETDEEYLRLYEIVAPYTLLWSKRLKSLYTLSKKICESDLQGNFVECGVAHGGSSLLLASVIKQYGLSSRQLFSCDTFEGMPDPDERDKDLHQRTATELGWGAGTVFAPLENLEGVCKQHEVWDIVVPVKGLFQETLPQKRGEIGPIAFLHMDGDWYESTMAILDYLYDQLVPGAYVQVDDYGHWLGCRQAIHDFENKRDIKLELNKIDYGGVWFQVGQG